MRILYLIDHLGFGGAQTALVNLVTAWPRRDDRIHVLSLGRQADLRGRFAGLPNVEVTVLGHRRWDLRSVRAVQRVIGQDTYDILHAHLCKAVCISLWTKGCCRAPLVSHVHNDMRFDWRILRLTLRHWQARAAAVVAVSQHTARIAQQTLGLPGDRVHTIYNPTRLPPTDSSSGKALCSSALRSELGLRPSDFVIGFVGRLCSVKGLTYLLQALASLAVRRPDIHAVIVGDGPLAASLRQEAARRGIADRVRFVGYQLDVARWLSIADVATFPSIYEGLPMAVVEAMRQGVPVIASNIDGIPEVVHAEQTGLLIPAGDVDALQAAILRLVDDRPFRQQLAHQARALAEHTFLPERIGEQLRALYGRLLQA